MRVTRPLYRAIAIGGLFIVYGALTVWGQSGNQLDFNLAPRHETGLNTTQTIVADLDLDGRLDIASVNGGQQNPNPSLTIRYGNSSAGFESQIVRPTFTIGETLAAGDLNGDSLPEIVVASWYQNVVAVFVNLGDRQFSSPVFSYPPNPNSPAVGEYYDLAIEDFDGDGNNDVVGLEDRQGQRLRFFHFNADASLTVFATLDQIGQASSSEGEMAVGDINSDGRADVVLAGGGPFGPRSISFVFGQQFGQSLTMTFGFSVFDESNDIALADFDHDSDLDIAVISQFTNNSFDHAARIYRNNGNLSFTGLSPQLFSNPFIPVSIVASDLDNDGNPDLAILMDSPYDHGVMVRAVFGNGNGTFADERYFAVAFSSSIAAADFNRDGRNDLITASSFLLQTDYSQYTDVSNNAVSIILNRPARNFDAPPVVLWGPHFIESGDFNNDGLADLVSSWSTGLGSTSGVDILINDAHGGFAPRFIIHRRRR
ncbi:MAG: VCBS repeat-containing protein [Acidobacteria bacterium]|nr:VCBS repeat-containing protein [Acidobacteriota bacterium]